MARSRKRRMPWWRGGSPLNAGPRRQRRRLARRSLRQVLMQLCLGCVLVGCHSTTPAMRATADSLAVLNESQDFRVRREAYRKLANTKKMSAENRANALQQLVSGSAEEANPLVRAAAVEALYNYDEAEAVDAIVQATDDSEPVVRAAACRGLAGHDEAAIEEVLAERLRKDSDDEVRCAAIEALAAMKNDRCNGYVMDALRDPNFTIVHSAENALTEQAGINLGTNPDAWAEYFETGKPPEKTRNLANRPERTFIDRVLLR